VLRSKGELAEAIAAYREQVELNQRFLGLGHPETIKAISSLAATLGRNGIWRARRHCYKRCCRASRRIGRMNHRS